MALATKQRDRPHARIYAEWMHLPAWKALKAESVALLVHTMATYRPNDGNCFEISDRRAAELARCSRPTAARALANLVDHGWLEIERIGKITGTLNSRKSRYSLTCQPRYMGEAAKMTFLHWRPMADGQNESHQWQINVPSTAKDQTHPHQSLLRPTTPQGLAIF